MQCYRRTECRGTEQPLGRANPRWKGIRRDYTADDVVRLRGSVHIESTLARRGAEKLWQLLHDRALRPRPGRRHRQPGHADGRGRA